MVATMIFLVAALAQPVQLLESTGPAAVTEATYKLDKNKTSTLVYTVTNQGSEPVTRYRLRVYRMAGEKKLGFKTVVKHASIEPGASVKDTVILGWILGDAESISAVIVEESK